MEENEFNPVVDIDPDELAIMADTRDIFGICLGFKVRLIGAYELSCRNPFGWAIINLVALACDGVESYWFDPWPGYWAAFKHWWKHS